MRQFLVLTAVLFLGLTVCGAKRNDWVEVRSTHFIVVTDAGEKRARATAEQFERIQTFFRDSLAVANIHPSPLVAVLAARDASTMREILPQYWSPGHAHPAGVFVRKNEKCFALVELDTQRSGKFAVVYHEYYHAITEPDFPDLPVWLSEGLAQFYGLTEITDTHVGTGKPDRDLLNLLRAQPLIPLNILFTVDHSSPYYNESHGASIFYAESWLLTHYLMIGNTDAHQLLIQYLQALNQKKSWSEATAAFGDLKKLQSELTAYMRQKKFLYLSSPLPPIESNEFKVRALSKSDVSDYLKEFSTSFGAGR